MEFIGVCWLALSSGTTLQVNLLFCIGTTKVYTIYIIHCVESTAIHAKSKVVSEDDIYCFSHDRVQPLLSYCFLQTHLICTVPEYTGARRPTESKAVCQVVINSGGKLSEGQQFIYSPGKISVPFVACSKFYAHLILLHPVSAEDKIKKATQMF